MAKRGFTLIEALVVIMIMGIVMSMVAFSMISSRSNARDERRKADLAAVMTAVVKYRADCGVFPSDITFGGSLTGSQPLCRNNTYLSVVPNDPQGSGKSYSYNLIGTSGFKLCAALESGGTAVSGCNESCGATACNYAVSP